MRKDVAAIALSCLLASPVLAGPYSLGVRAGSSIPNLRAGNDDPMSTGWSTRVAPYFGLFADFEVSPAFSIRPEISYAAQGGKRDGMQPVPDASAFGAPPGTVLYANYKNVAKLDYLEIPVLARYRFGNGRGFYVNAGPYAGILLAASNETSGISPVYSDPHGANPVSPAVDFGASTDVKGDLHTFNWGIQGGAGFAQPLGHGTLELDVRGGLGLANVQKDTAANGKNSTGNLVVALGYSWSFRAP